MKTNRSCSLIVLAAAWMTSYSIAGVKDIKAEIRQKENAGKAAEFQLQARVALPSFEVGAHIDAAFFIVDQQAGSTEAMLNKSGKPIMLSLYGFETGKGVSAPDWLDLLSSKKNKVSNQFLQMVSGSRRNGNQDGLASESLRFDVTDFVRAQLKGGNRDIAFQVAASVENAGALHKSKVDFNLANVRGRLVIHYTDPPILPPGIRSQ